MKVAVLDTSALMRLFIPDGPVPAGLEDFLDSAWLAEANLCMPELTLAEAGQVLWRKEQSGLLRPKKAADILDAILQLPVEVVGHGGIIDDALDLARRYKVTVYDALFLALALERRGALFTSDKALEKVFDQIN